MASRRAHAVEKLIRRWLKKLIRRSPYVTSMRLGVGASIGGVSEPRLVGREWGSVCRSAGREDAASALRVEGERRVGSGRFGRNPVGVSGLRTVRILARGGRLERSLMARLLSRDRGSASRPVRCVFPSHRCVQDCSLASSAVASGACDGACVTSPSKRVSKGGF